MELYKTTTDLLEASKDLLAEAEKVTTREEHIQVWDKKVEILRAVNKALETGYYIGDSYEELTAAKHYLFKAEEKAGKQSALTYMKE